MKTIDAIKTFSHLDVVHKRCVFSRDDLCVMFPDDSPATLNKSIERLTQNGLLERVARGVYVYSLASSKGHYLLEQIALCLRPRELSYISLESALSQYGRISQIPIGVLTLMTTGRSGRYKTPYGIIEFTHTKRSQTNIAHRVCFEGDSPIPFAKEQAAIEDLKRVGRNLSIVDEQWAAEQ